MNEIKKILIIILVISNVITFIKADSISNQSIGFNFTAATVSNTHNINAPPNLNGWVGPEQYILMSYNIIRSFNKFTGQADGVLNIDSFGFFGVIAQDVRINYSRYEDKWFLSCESQDPVLNYPTELVLFWSDTGIITPDTVWNSHTFPNATLVPQNNLADGPAFVDYQQLATDANAVYISLDTFDATSFSYLGTTSVVMPNSSFVPGNAFNFTIFPGILPVENPASSANEFSPPADNFDPNPGFGYMLSAAFNNFFEGTGTILNFFRIINPGTTPATLGPLIEITVPVYATGDAIGNLFGNAPHKGNLYGLPGFLQTGSGTIEAPHVRNKQLYVCQDCTLDGNGNADANGDRIGVRWYQFDLTGDPTGHGLGTEMPTTVPALIQYGTLFDSALTNPKSYYIPSIMTNKNVDLIIEGTVSGNDDYTNVFFASRKATDPLGTLSEPVLLTNNTSNPYNFGPLVVPSNENIGQRWGDETSLAPDPSNDLDIWSTGEWAAVVNGWGIQVTQLKPS